MECTQRLECTQELLTQAQRECPEQVGFLGICGNKYPVKKGPNKIGRDPQMCNIVLNLNSVSRQHAVLNVLNKKDFMLMDLDSANKTKMLGKPLQPYVPHPLKNGDMVQFGEVFGIFRLLEDEDELPMTQAINIPDTPVPTRHVSKLNIATTVPESPDVSDKDDSFIIASQSKGPYFKSSNTHFIKPGKTISIQPVGGRKIDNIYWNSSKKSTSLNLDDSFNSLNESIPFVKLNEKENEANASNIHEMDTQALLPPKLNQNKDSIHEANTQAFPPTVKECPGSIHDANTQAFPPTVKECTGSIHEANTQALPPPVKECIDSIHEANTQLPESDIPRNMFTNTDLQVGNTLSPSIYTANTQLPSSSNSSASIYMADTQAPGAFHSPSIHSLYTQLPQSENMPEVCKINGQQDMRFDIRAHKDTSICNSKNKSDNSPVHAKNITGSPFSRNSNEDSKFNKSDDIVLFDEIDGDAAEDNFESQAILVDDVLLPVNRCVETESEQLSQIVLPKSRKRNMRIQSDSSTDCDDIDDEILPTQKIPAKSTVSSQADSTDCEDELIELKPVKNKSPVMDLDDVATQVIEVIQAPATHNADIEDMLTQVIDVDYNTKNEAHNNDIRSNLDFVDLPTQVLVEDVPTKTPHNADIEDMLTQVIDVDYNTKNEAHNNDNRSNLDFEDLPTQVLVEDVPTKTPSVQKSIEVDISPFKIPLKSAFKAKKKDLSKSPMIKTTAIIDSKNISVDDKYYQDTQDIFEDLCTQKIEPEVSSSTKKTQQGDVKNDTSPHSMKHETTLNTSLTDSDVEEKINNFVTRLSSQDIRDVIGVETVAPLSRMPSDASDLELTPKKIGPLKFLDTDLPNSQEIKTSVSLNSKSVVTESSSESEPENSEDQCTPILFRRKKKTKKDAKLDLVNKFNVESLPTRVLTRIRKPTAKVQQAVSKKITEAILKPKFLTEQDDVDTDIITENITRLKNKNEKSKTAKESSKVSKVDETKSRKGNNESDITNATILNNSKKSYQETSFKEGNSVGVNSSKSPIELDHKAKCNNSHIKPEDKVLEYESKKESNRQNKSALSPQEFLNKIDETSESLEAKIVPNEKHDKKTRTTRNNKTSASKITDEKRGPIMIEPHVMTAPVKEKPKREYKRKNKDNDKKVDSLDSKQEKSTDTSNIDVNMTIETKRPVRSTRGKRKTVEAETEQTEKRPKRSQKQKEEPQKEVQEEVRRSSRQRVVKVKEDKSAVTSILKKSVGLEQSAVYDLSSGSNDSPGVKRSIADDIEAPLPKRTRSVVNTASRRATPSRTQKTCYVLFTAFPYEDVKTKLEKLGAVVVTDVKQCSVVVTLQVRRTFKLLCAVGLGRPIVGPNWVQSCVDTNMIVDPWLFTIKDEAAEKRFKFSLMQTLSGKRDFLRGYNLSATPNVMPAAPEMKLIVECSGGTWREGGPRWLCLTCAADRELWPALRARGAALVTTELILGGALRQRLDIHANSVHVP